MTKGPKERTTCSHGFEYSEAEMDAGHRLIDLITENESEAAAYELDQDREHEAELARQEARGTAECPWPWYADEPYEVEEPEVIG